MKVFFIILILQAKMLEEMDAEFGIGKIVEDEFSKTKEQVSTHYIMEVK